MELQIQNVTKSYRDKKAVDQLNFTLKSGIYGLLGPNGAGKSTLLGLLCGLARPTGGNILLNGKPILSLGARYFRVLGYLPQDFVCYPDFTAEEFLLYMAAMKGCAGRGARERTAELLRLVGLADVRRKKTKTFSGGMRQRLGIAQALLNDPKILILDEPTAGLDPGERVRFRNYLSTFSQERLVILSTHIVSDVADLSDRVLLLKNGRTVYFGANPSLCGGSGRLSLEELYLSYFGGEGKQ